MRLWPSRQREVVDPPPEVWPPLDGWPVDGSLNDILTAFGYPWSPRLAERVWTANRCIQLVCQQIASMPLRYYGPPSGSEPAWVANPDPVWYPNGIGDAVFSMVHSQLGWGDCFLYVTDRYQTGYPSAWTVLDPATNPSPLGPPSGTSASIWSTIRQRSSGKGAWSG